MFLIRKFMDRAFGRTVSALGPEKAVANAASKARGNAALAAGDLGGATAAYRQAVLEDANDPLAHLNLGFVLLEQGLAGEAERCLRQAVHLEEGLADAHYLLGGVRQAQSDWAGARDCYLRATRLRPAFDFAWRDLGVAWERLGDTARALDSYERAAALRPEMQEAVGGCARLCAQRQDHDGALRWARHWARAAPDAWEPLVVQAQALAALQQPEQALDVLVDAQRRTGAPAVIHHLRGNALFAMERFAQAALAYEAAADAQPDLVQAFVNGAVARQRVGHPEQALPLLAQALALEPNNLSALYNRTVCLLDAGRIDEAIAAGEQALEKCPGEHDLEWNLGLAHLLAGHLERGWHALEARWQAGAPGPHGMPQMPHPRWTGAQPVAGKTLLLVAEQGLGDSIQFVRYAPKLARQGARVVLWIPAALDALLRRSLPECEVVTTAQQLPRVDYQCPLMSLPLAFNTTLQDIPAQERYLHSEPALRDAWSRRLGRRLSPQIGLVWSGNRAHKNDRNRSIPLSVFTRLTVPGCQFVSLQQEVRDEDRVALDAWSGLVHFGHELASFADTAALIDALDLVISVDTSVAHLAAALGKPVWLLLPYRPDWRWLMNRPDSPWYPTARLFRQDQTRDWAAVLDRVRLALAQVETERGTCQAG